MRLFKRSKPEKNQEKPSLAVLDLDERMSRLERRIRDIETDWNQTYDKFHRLSMRLAKRAKSEEKEPEDAPQEPIAPQPTQNPLAQQLLRRGRIA